MWVRVPMHRYLHLCLIYFRPPVGDWFSILDCASIKGNCPRLASFLWQFPCLSCSCSAGPRVPVTAAAGFGHSVRERFPLLPTPDCVAVSCVLVYVPPDLHDILMPDFMLWCIYRYVHTHTHMHTRISLFLSLCVRPSVRPSVRLSVCLSVCLCLSLSLSRSLSLSSIDFCNRCRQTAGSAERRPGPGEGPRLGFWPRARAPGHGAPGGMVPGWVFLTVDNAGARDSIEDTVPEIVLKTQKP